MLILGALVVQATPVDFGSYTWVGGSNQLNSLGVAAPGLGIYVSRTNTCSITAPITRIF